MIDIIQLQSVLAPTDLSLAQKALDSIRWSYGDVKYLGATFIGPAGESTPVSSPAIEVMRTSLPPWPTRATYMLTGSMTLTDGSTAPCLVLAGAHIEEADLTETMAANIDRLATILGYTASIEGVTTPLWVIPMRALINDDFAQSQITIKKFNTGGFFDTVAHSNAYYISVSNFTIVDNRTRCQPVVAPTVYTVGDDVCIRTRDTVAGISYLYMSEKQYLTDMQNVQDIANYIVAAMGNPSETTELTARVGALETAIATEVSLPTAAAISTAVSAETTQRTAAVSGLALAVSQIPVFGAKLVDVANAANTVGQYIPRT